MYMHFVVKFVTASPSPSPAAHLTTSKRLAGLSPCSLLTTKSKAKDRFYGLRTRLPHHR